MQNIPREWREADITISGVQLNFAQSMTVRVAVANMLLELQDPNHREALGAVAEGYGARLLEVQSLILRSAS